MSTLDLPEWPAAEAAAERRVRKAVRRAAALVATWRTRSRDRHLLARMSDRELADIGECRASVAHLIERPFWRS